MWAVNAEVVLKATNVDGVYDADPRQNPNARLLETVSYHEVTTRDLSVMDMTAITLCQENNIPSMDAISLTLYWFCISFFKILIYHAIFAVVVFNLQEPGNIAKAIVGKKVGTFVGCKRNQKRNENTLVEERRLVNEVWAPELKELGLSLLSYLVYVYA